MEPSIQGRRSRHFGVSGNVSPRFARQKHFSCASRRTPRSRSRRFLRFGSRSVVTPGVRARGWGGTRTSSRTRPPSAEPPSWRPSCSSRGVRGVGGQWLEGGTPGKWPACRKKRRKRPGGDAPGAAEAGFWSASGEKGHAGDVRQTGRKGSASSRAACLSREGECENARGLSPERYFPVESVFGFSHFAFHLSRVFFERSHTLPRAWRQAWRPPPPPRMASPTRATSRSTWTK